MFPGPAVPGSCLVSFYFRWAIHPIRPVEGWRKCASRRLFLVSGENFLLLAVPLKPLSLSLSLSLSWLAPYTLLSFLARCGNLFPHDHKIMPLPPPSASATSVPLDDSLWIDPWFWYAAVPSLGPGGGAEGDDDGKE